MAPGAVAAEVGAVEAPVAAVVAPEAAVVAPVAAVVAQVAAVVAPVAAVVPVVLVVAAARAGRRRLYSCRPMRREGGEGGEDEQGSFHTRTHHKKHKHLSPHTGSVNQIQS